MRHSPFASRQPLVFFIHYLQKYPVPLFLQYRTEHSLLVCLSPTGLISHHHAPLVCFSPKILITCPLSVFPMRGSARSPFLLLSVFPLLCTSRVTCLSFPYSAHHVPLVCHFPTLLCFSVAPLPLISCSLYLCIPLLFSSPGPCLSFPNCSHLLVLVFFPLLLSSPMVLVCISLLLQPLSLFPYY